MKNKREQCVIDFRDCNLHVINYSSPVRARMSLEELRPLLYARPELPYAIPYVTTYYEERWGFCLSWNDLQGIPEGRYEVVIDSSLVEGQLTFADTLLRGRSNRELLLSTYVCHPSMANHELSGPVVSAFLYRLLREMDLRYTYRFVYAPETIGALVYLSRHGEDVRPIGVLELARMIGP